MTGPSTQALLAETARLAHHFHWSLDSILDLEALCAVRAADNPHRIAVGIDAFVEPLQVIEVRSEQALDQRRRDVGDRANAGHGSRHQQNA